MSARKAEVELPQTRRRKSSCSSKATMMETLLKSIQSLLKTCRWREGTVHLTNPDWNDSRFFKSEQKINAKCSSPVCHANAAAKVLQTIWNCKMCQSYSQLHLLSTFAMLMCVQVCVRMVIDIAMQQKWTRHIIMLLVLHWLSAFTHSNQAKTLCHLTIVYLQPSMSCCTDGKVLCTSQEIEFLKQERYGRDTEGWTL